MKGENVEDQGSPDKGRDGRSSIGRGRSEKLRKIQYVQMQQVIKKQELWVDRDSGHDHFLFDHHQRLILTP